MVKVQLDTRLCSGRFMGVRAVFHTGASVGAVVFFPSNTVKEAECLGCDNWLAKTSPNVPSVDASVLSIPCDSSQLFCSLVSNLEMMNTEAVPEELRLKQVLSFIGSVQLRNESKNHKVALQRAAEDLSRASKDLCGVTE